jgi:hypothetical protein
MWSRAVQKKLTDVREEHSAAILMVEEYAQQEAGMKQSSTFFRNVGKLLLGYTAPHPRR